MSIMRINQECSICGKKGENFIVIEPGKDICDSCAEKIYQAKSYVNEIESSYRNNSSNDGGFQFHQGEGVVIPMEIKAKLDQYIVGQEMAKKILSVACYNHYKRNEMHDESIKKSNILMVGPTGSGKTYLVTTLAKVMNVPIAIVPSTTLTEAGYIGDDVGVVVQRLLEAAGGDVSKAERGIIFIDEIDKLAGRSSETEKKVGGKGVQQALLALLEGTVVEVAQDTKEPRNQGIKVNVDTSGILFICGGAFPEAEAIIKRRLTKQKSIGFNAVVENNIKNEDLLLQIKEDDLREYGFIPEFLGRLPILAPLQNLSIEMLKRILIEPKDSICSQFVKLFKFDGVELFFEENALDLIAEMALKRGTGARALRSVLENLLFEAQFEIPSRKDIDSVRITSAFVKGESEIEYHVTKSNRAASY